MSFYFSRNLNLAPGTSINYYKYQSLAHPGEDIRIISVLPGNYEDDIQIEIQHFPLVNNKECQSKGHLTRKELQNNLPQGWHVYETEGRFLFSSEQNGVAVSSWAHPSPDFDQSLLHNQADETKAKSEGTFEALSYVWGPQENPEQVKVVDTASSHQRVNSLGSILVGRNLVVALRHLRSKDNPRKLWVDALCINQDDTKEREGQVGLMRDIYRLAARVVVWLGQATNGSRLALSALGHLGAQVEVTIDGLKVPSPGAEEVTWVDDRVTPPYAEQTWEEIHDLLARSWFSRLWVVQEIALANCHAVAQCGEDVVKWALIRRAARCLYSKERLPRSGLRQLVLDCVRISEDHQGKPFMVLMENSRLQQCFDLKDKVYGMLGLAPRLFAKKICPAYSDDVSVADAFKDVFLKHLDHVRRWELFGCEMADRKIGGPSWVPDWAAPDVPGWGSRQQYTSGNSRIHFEFRSPSTLIVTGVQCAVVSTVNEAVTSGDPAKDMNIVQSWQPEGLYDKAYVNGDSLLNAYAVTLLQFRLRDRWPNNHYMPKLEDWKSQKQAPPMFGTQAIHTGDARFDRSISLSHRAYNCVLRRLLFTTSEGYIGLAPIGTRPGDIVCIFLGCDPPVILRPQSDDTYQLIGYCFVYGLHDSTALLGDLPKPWKAQLRRHKTTMFREIYQFFNEETGELTDEDPRLTPHPDWERVSLDQLGRELDSDDPTICDFFKNNRTGEVVDSDPRLLPEALQPYIRSQGRELRGFSLV
ncbi:heterokaryon incompatibility protein-domain-containing protein [Hypoxylon fuscum]|nr:heterokaryon incompatibility protein-domain-containing protein [Hypoxylon fuscum]